MIQDQRIHSRNRQSIKDKRYVIYWMQASQRAHYNHALEYAIQKANDLRKPLIVLFGITESFPGSNLRHYQFMFEGLKPLKAELANRGIQFVLLRQSPEKAASLFATDACLVITDSGYLRIQRKWRDHVAAHIHCPLVEIETDVIVPVEEASYKDEFSAGTFRPRITGKLDKYLVPLKARRLKFDSLGLRFDTFDLDDLDKLKIDRNVAPSAYFYGGNKEAKLHLRNFVARKLPGYDTNKNDPGLDSLSNMSPYLHFGQISPLYIALEILKAGGRAQNPIWKS